MSQFKNRFDVDNSLQLLLKVVCIDQCDKLQIFVKLVVGFVFKQNLLLKFHIFYLQLQFRARVYYAVF